MDRIRLVLGIILCIFPNLLFSQSGYTMKFNFSMEDIKGTLLYSEAGTIDVCGGKYRVEIPDELLIVCDGASQWIYNFVNEDVVVMHSDISGKLESLAEPGAIAENIIPLFAADLGKYETSVKKDAQGMPVAITLRSKKDIYKISIGSVKKTDNCNGGKFVFDIQKYPNAIITDLR